MPRLNWDQTGQRFYETGVDRGVLYTPNASGVYDTGVAWNGLTTVTESPSGAESTPQYADNIKYLNLVSAEEFSATIEAFTYPNQFAQHDGTYVTTGGIALGQQTRKPFGLAYRTRVGNDLAGTDLGYKLHLVYNAQAAPSEKAYSTINDSPEAITFSWEVTTTSVPVGVIDGVERRPVSLLTVDSRAVTAAGLAALEDALYGNAGAGTPRLPTPAEVIALVGTPTQLALITAPTFTSPNITIPATANVTYYVNGVLTPAGQYTIPAPSGTVATVKVYPNVGYVLNPAQDDTWVFVRV